MLLLWQSPLSYYKACALTSLVRALPLLLAPTTYPDWSWHWPHCPDVPDQDTALTPLTAMAIQTEMRDTPFLHLFHTLTWNWIILSISQRGLKLDWNERYSFLTPISHRDLELDYLVNISNRFKIGLKCEILLYYTYFIPKWWEVFYFWITYRESLKVV